MTRNSTMFPLFALVTLLSWSGLPIPAAAQTVSFITRRDLAVGSLPRSVSVGDFDGDGIVDMAVANAGGSLEFYRGSISVLLGKSDGTFQPAVTFGAGVQSWSVTVADFNGDGKLDLAVANAGHRAERCCPFNRGSVSVLLGNGDGTFQAALDFAAGPSPRSVAVGDINGDGKLDLVVANWGWPGDPGNVSVLLGNGDGTFQAPLNIGAGDFPVSVAVGDFNGDGKLDLAVANQNDPGPGTVSVLLGIGDGTFLPAVAFRAGTYPTYVAASDVNGDGRLDLVVADGASNTVAVLLGTGTGIFLPPQAFAAGQFPISVAVADLNGDGHPDLAVADYSYWSAAVSVLLGNGDGAFRAAASFRVGSFGTSVAVGDFNRDGRPDLAVANLNSANVSVLPGYGDGTFEDAASFPAGSYPSSVVTGDFNGDGKLDMAVANAGFPSGGDIGSVSLLLSKGDGTFQPALNLVTGTSPHSVAVGDFNGDGKLDLAVANAGYPAGGDPGSVSVLLGNGDGTFQAALKVAAGTSPYSVVVGDFNGDGKLDLAVANNGNFSGDSGGVSMSLGNGDGTFQSAVSFAAGSHPSYVAVGDFNGDGKLDLVVNSWSGVLALLGNGEGTFQAATNVADSGVYSVAVGDFNGDGKLDLAVTNGSGRNNNVSVLLGNGDGTFRAGMSFPVGYSPYSIVVGDFNGDGAQDLAVASTDQNDVSLLLGKGDGTFQAVGVFGAGLYPWSMTAGDFNGDGKLDLAVANTNSNDVSVLINSTPLP